MLIKDHIRRHVFTIHEGADFREALEAMIGHKTNGLIVVDDDGRPVGIIDSFLLINQIIPPYLHDDPMLATFEPEGVFYKEVSEHLHDKIKDIMKDLKGVEVKEEDPIILAATLASKHDFRYIPVVDDDHHLLGLVSRTDIKRAMAELLGIKDE